MDTILQGVSRAFGLLASFDRELYSIIFLSLKVSGLAVIIAASLGIPLGALCALRRFPGRGVAITLLNTLMGLPPVVAGLLVYLFLSRSGPLGFLGLLFSPSAMVIAQVVIALPIVSALTWSAVASVGTEVRETAIVLGAGRMAVDWAVLKEARVSVLAAVIAGFGRATAEVGAVLMVGGNIGGYTRVMTTTIAMETSKGSFELAIALGVVLLSLAFIINFALRAVQGRGSMA
ncbi:MAG TPA: ABC transporter permease [Nitrospirota bacterium]